MIFFIILNLKSIIYTHFPSFFSIKWFFHTDLGFYIFFCNLIVSLVVCDYRLFYARVVVVVLVQQAVVSSQDDSLVFVANGVLFY